MRLELVMLTTVISMITERQVEAQLKCFENRDGTGKSVVFTKSNPNLVTQFPNGPKVCQVPANTAYIFYSDVNYVGQVNTILSKKGEKYYPSARFSVQSIFILEQLSPDGVHLFLRTNFQGGSPKSFSKKDDSVTDGSPFLSAIVMGSVDWTVTRDCNGKKCDTCLKADKQGGASFMQDIKNGVLEDVISISRATCSGTNYVGKPIIPDNACLCNQDGVVEGPNKCNGVGGVCPCKSNYTGDDCSLCNGDGLTWREGKCVDGCGCNPLGVKKGVMTCDRYANYLGYGYCYCDWYGNYRGKKCDTCDGSSYENYDGQCLTPKCHYPNTLTPSFANYDGHCFCMANYRGLCDTCKKGYQKYLIKCLSQPQFNKVMELKHVADNKIDDDTLVVGIMNDLVNLGVMEFSDFRINRYELEQNITTAYAVAKDFTTHQSRWRV